MLNHLQFFLVAAVAALHVYILILEMFLWTKPRGLKTFRMSEAQAKETATLAANQGLYNGFLAAGLVWSLAHPSIEVSYQLTVFFLGCVIVAAIYGGATVGRRIFFVQGVPAIAALIVSVLALGTVSF